MQRRTLAVVVFVSLLGVAGSAKADTIGFSFVSAPNINGTYVDASGTLTGILTFSDPGDFNVLVTQSGGTITVVSNIPPSPDPNGEGTFPLTPELNGSGVGGAGYFQFNNSPNGIIVSDGHFPLSFGMPGNPADGGPFDIHIFVSGLNGTANNSEFIASDDGNGPDQYITDGTLTLYGQVGAYDLTPEPASLLLLGSGVALLVFMVYRKSLTSEPLG